jgi:hypothetical protein
MIKRVKNKTKALPKKRPKFLLRSRRPITKARKKLINIILGNFIF